MHYCVIGSGAMGGLYGLRLIAAGKSVSFLDIDREHIDVINENGFRLSGITGDNSYEVMGSTDPAALEGLVDVVLFHTHTNGTKAGAKAASIVLKPEGWAVTFQNGIGNVETLVAALGEERVVGGISYHSANLVAAGHTEHTNVGPTYIGELNGERSERVNELIKELESAGFEPKFSSNIMSVIWSKFTHNCAINAICAVSGLRSGDVARNASADALQTKILDEVLSVVLAKGIPLMPENSKEYIKTQTGLRFNKPSMLQHMESARPTEIDALNGALVEEAQNLGISVPFNEALVMMVKAREAAMAELSAGVVRDYARMEREAQGLKN